MQELAQYHQREVDIYKERAIFTKRGGYLLIEGYRYREGYFCKERGIATQRGG